MAQLLSAHREGLPLSGRTITCHGVKTASYVRALREALLLGLDLTVYVENDWEVATVCELAHTHEAKGALSLGLRLMAPFAKEDGSISAEAAKFGLAFEDAVAAALHVRKAGLEDALRMVHVHAGSNIQGTRLGQGRVCLRPSPPLHEQPQFLVPADADHMYRAVRSAVELFQELRCRQGFHGLAGVNLGGGLPAGAASRPDAPGEGGPPTARGMARTAAEALAGIREALGPGGVEVVVEAGRAVAAHHVAIVVECVGVRGMGTCGGTSPLAMAMCDFSVFSAVPDAWGLGERFLALPLCGLHRPVAWSARIADATCDSDGVLPGTVDFPEGFFDHGDALPPWVGVFAVGAYQRMLAGRHNNIGPPTLVHFH